MAETAFDRTERGLGSADLSIPDIVARTKGNPQDIMKLVMNGQINVTQGLLAKRLSDSVVAERNAMAAQQPSVLQEQFPEMAQATGGLGAMPQAAPPMPAQMGPQMGPQMGAPAPQGMPPAQGGIGGLDFAPTQMAGGGIVGYATGDPVGRVETREERLERAREMERRRKKRLAIESERGPRINLPSGSDFASLIDDTRQYYQSGAEDAARRYQQGDIAGALGAQTRATLGGLAGFGKDMVVDPLANMIEDRAAALFDHGSGVLDFGSGLFGLGGDEEESSPSEERVALASRAEADAAAPAPDAAAPTAAPSGTSTRTRGSARTSAPRTPTRGGSARTSAPRTPTRGGSTSGTRSSSPFSPELFAPSKLDAAGSLAGVREALPQRTAAMDAYMAKLAEGVDPEKARKQAEIAGLLAGLGSVEAGMTPMEALVSGFVGGGKQIQQAEKDMEAKEMELLKAQVDVEQLRNKMDADQFGLAMQIAQANMQGADAATARMLQIELAKYTAAERRQIAAAANALGYAQLNQRRAESDRDHQLKLFEALRGGGPSFGGVGFTGLPQVPAMGGMEDSLELARSLGLIPEPNDEGFEVVKRR